ncbi:hypothetical protein FB451DRAFT_311656 [Mycena latifolia]|nr:hypothetical protein FB451DRAFT_311656 [Mycena latifolia]
MLSSSASAPHLKRRSSEDDELELDPRLLKRGMNLLWEESKIQECFAERDWKKLGNDVSKKKFPKLSVPFTDGINFYEGLFEDREIIVALKEDEDELSGQAVTPAGTVEEQAATALLNNELWKGVQEHVVVQNETGCRTIIDLVLIAVIAMAQREVASNDSLDQDLSQRHGFPDDQKKYHGVQSRILLHQEVEIPDQDLKVGLAFHGFLAYMVAIIPRRMLIPKREKPTLVGAGITGLLSPKTIANSIAYIQEAKSLSTMESAEDGAQVIVQGAAMCVLTKRPTVINVLTNGIFWTFYIISKSPDGDKAEKPFRSSKTRTLHVLEPEDLAIILRLLKAAVCLLYSPSRLLLTSLVDPLLSGGVRICGRNGHGTRVVG